jgi:CHAT domain-containing protein/tetratricopeptide (TPR) repeat protein
MRIRTFAHRSATAALALGLSSVTMAADELPISGETVIRELPGGGADRIELAAHAGDYVELSVDPRGTLLSVKAEREVVGARSGARVYMPMRLCWIAKAAPLRIRVESQEAHGTSRSYGIALVARRAAGSADKERVWACSELRAAEQSLDTGSAGTASALTHFESALSHWETVGDTRPQAETLLEIGIAAERLGQTAEAVASYKRSADIYRRLQDRRSLALTLQYLGVNYEVAGDLKNAGLAYDESLKASREVHDRVGEANALLNPAAAKAQRNDSSQLEQVLAIYREQGHRRGQALALNLLGVFYFGRGEPETALRFFDEALALRRVLHDREGEGQVLNNKASLLFELGETRESLRLKQQVLAIRQQWGSVADVLITRYNIANNYLALGEYEKALELFEQVHVGARSAGHSRAEAFALQGIGNVYRTLGEPDQAAPSFEQSAALFRQSKDLRGEAISVTSLGLTQQMKGDLKKAQATLSDALQLAKDGKLRQQVSAASAALGHLAVLTGDYKRARPLLEEALASARTSENRRSVTVALEGLGDASFRSGQVEEARTYFRNALVEATAIQSPREQAISGIGLARTEMAAGDLEDASIHARAALRALESERSGLSSPEVRASYLSTAGEDYRVAVEILMALDERKPHAGFAEEAFSISERGRARSLLDALSAARLKVGPDAGAGLRDAESSGRALLDEKAEYLIRLLARKHTGAQAAAAEMELARAEDLYKQAQQRVWRASPRYAELVRASPAGIADVQKVMPDGALLLEYSLGETASVVWIVTKSSAHAECLAPRKEIEPLALAAVNALTEPGRSPAGETIAGRRERLERAAVEFSKTSAELSRRLWPASLSGVKATRIWVVPDGALQYVPFAALPREGAPLVDSVEVSTLPSASALLYLGSRVRAPIEKVAVFADPVFSADDPRVRGAVPAAEAVPSPFASSQFAARAADFDLDSLHRLRFSREEAEEIAAVSGSARVRVEMDFAANRENALSAASSKASILHFATHALLDEKRPELSGIVLSLVGPDGRPRNGFLRLVDIYQWRINAQLVVLSACRTALGTRLENEGQIGLVRGFFYAGASDVLATLWSVDDRATAIFMARFYQALLRDKLPPSTALRRAQNEIRKDGRWSDPFYWSGFSLIGG